MSDEMQARAVEVRLLQVENAELRKRIADLEAENLRYAKRLDAIWLAQHEPEEPESDESNRLHRRIDKLADRIAELEREQRRCEGEI